SRACLIAISLLFASTLGASAQGDAMGRRALLYAASGTFGVQGILYTLDPATGAVLTTEGPLHAHRAGKRFVCRADEKLTAFLELERAVCIHLLSEHPG